MRTFDEIVQRIHDTREDDFFGTVASDLAAYLPNDRLEEAGFAVAEGVTNRPVAPRDDASVIAQIVDYLPFAWGKANNCRGLSAGRSIDHMTTWLWMLGEDDAATAIQDYIHYGKPQLRAISEKYGFAWQDADTGRWANSEEDEGISASSVPAVDLKWKP